jgi:hypothetical protein
MVSTAFSIGTKQVVRNSWQKHQPSVSSPSIDAASQVTRSEDKFYIPYDLLQRNLSMFCAIGR